MMAKKRFIQNVVSASETETTQMPWTRGARRAAFIAKRKSTEERVRKTA